MSPRRERFTDHLEALRSALLGMAWAWFLGMGVVVANFDALLKLLRAPLAAAQGVELITLSPLAALFIGCDVVAVGGAIVGAPLMILHLLRFILPALKENEKRAGVGLGLLAIGLFLAGVVFGFCWLLPASLQIALSIQDAMGFKLLWSAQDYFGLVVALPLVMGAAACLPLLLGALLRLGVIPYAPIVKRWDVATIAILILAAAITPTGDPISFLFIALPLGALYALALIFGKPKPPAATAPAGL